jgi:putative transposase
MACAGCCYAECMTVYRRMSHCVFYCDYHLVWPTKYRRKIFNEGMLAYLQEYLKSWPEHHPDVILKEVNIDQDHIHILVRFVLVPTPIPRALQGRAAYAQP